MALFLVYSLITAIMLINLLIAIFRSYCFSNVHVHMKARCVFIALSVLFVRNCLVQHLY